MTVPFRSVPFRSVPFRSWVSLIAAPLASMLMLGCVDPEPIDLYDEVFCCASFLGANAFGSDNLYIQCLRYCSTEVSPDVETFCEGRWPTCGYGDAFPWGTEGYDLPGGALGFVSDACQYSSSSYVIPAGTGNGCDADAHAGPGDYDTEPRYHAEFDDVASGDLEIVVSSVSYTPEYQALVAFNFEGCVASPCLLTLYSLDLESSGDEVVGAYTLSDLRVELAAPVEVEVDVNGDFTIDDEDAVRLYIRWIQDDGDPEPGGTLATNGTTALTGHVDLDGSSPVLLLDGTFTGTIGGISGSLILDDLTGAVINRPPTAVISNLPTSTNCVEDPQVPGFMEIDLDGSSSSDPENNIDHFGWWINGGDVLALGDQTSVHLPPGTHTVTLRVYDEMMAWSEETQEITIADPLGSCVP